MKVHLGTSRRPIDVLSAPFAVRSMVGRTGTRSLRIPIEIGMAVWLEIERSLFE